MHETDLKPADAGRTSRQPTAKSMVDLRFDLVSRFAGQESMISGLDPHPTTGVPDNITSCPIELSSHNLTTVKIVSDVHISRPSWHRRQLIPADDGSMPCRSKSGKCPLLYACAPELYATSSGQAGANCALAPDLVSSAAPADHQCHSAAVFDLLIVQRRFGAKATRSDFSSLQLQVM